MVKLGRQGGDLVIVSWSVHDHEKGWELARFVYKPGGWRRFEEWGLARFWVGQRVLEGFVELIGVSMWMWRFANFGRDLRGVGGPMRALFGFARLVLLWSDQGRREWFSGFGNTFLQMRELTGLFGERVRREVST
jgi:hypothetical protein